ncbi:uncharacterized protein ACNLHF_021986 [Anomaloglossus baeobatrachus]
MSQVQEDRVINDVDDLMIQISSRADNELVVETNYTILACIVDDHYYNIQSLFEDVQEQHHDTSPTNTPSTIDVTNPVSNTVCSTAQSNTHDSDSYDEIKTLLSQIKTKFGGDSANEECFPSNPLRIDNAKFIEFNEDHDENRIGIIDWCKCGKCVAMPTNIESICCKEVDNVEPYMDNLACITEHDFFFIFCEREETVHILQRIVGLTIGPSTTKEQNRKSRKTSYRSFTAWIHGPLGRGNRRPISSCVVNKVREAFPDADDSYMGFKATNEKPAEFLCLE